jgi:lipoprotein-anchoring transpeptidase ErfK/SrfK
MKASRFARWLILMGVVAGMAPGPMGASAARRTLPAEPASASSTAASYLCSPQTQMRDERRCPALGPSAARADLARRGVNPLRPLPIVGLDPSLSYLPFNYRKLDGDGTRVYSSAQDAASSTDAAGAIEPGLAWVSWSECQVIHDRAVYLTASGYVRGGSECKQTEMPSFHGLAFSRSPSGPFGWILGTTDVRTAPGFAAPVVGQRYRFAREQVLDRAQADDAAWVKIGADAWVAARDIAIVTPEAARPEGVEADRWISINLFEQTLAVYETGRLVFATMVSTGLPGWWTQPGTFQVYSRLERDDMSGAFEADRSDYYLLQDVPWVLYYDKARALHGAYWHNGYGYARSHGCVNLSPTDAHWIFNWAEEGTYVHVFDPSGQTPTDPGTYSEGGA